MNVERFAVWPDGSYCKIAHLHFHAFSHDEPPKFVDGYIEHGQLTVVHAHTDTVTSAEQHVA